MAVFRYFSRLARPVQTLLAWSTDGPPIAQGRQEMTFNLNVQQFLVSAIGALFAATLFVTAAVGPAGQLI
jgi:hypothetical protein